MAGLLLVCKGKGMWEWYWSLRGTGLVTATVAIVGGVIATILGLAVWVGRGITGVAEHNQATCSCIPCQRRREAAVARRVARGGYVGSIPVDQRSDWISTARLEPHMYVGLRGETYFVKNIRTDRMGYLIELRNLKNRRESIVTVKFEIANARYWRPIGHWEKS